MLRHWVVPGNVTKPKGEGHCPSRNNMGVSIMRSNADSITYPLTDATWMCFFTGTWLTLYGGICIYSLKDTGSHLFQLTTAVMALYFGLRSLAKGFIKMHLVPEGIALSLFGRTFRTYPIEQIQVALILNKQSTLPEEAMLMCLGCCSWEELAGLRENQLRKNPYMRSNIPYQKRRADWQKSFALAYLRKKISDMPWAIPGEGIFYMEYSRERRCLLQHMYPDLLLERMVSVDWQAKPVPMMKKTPADLRCHACFENLGMLLFLIPILPAVLMPVLPVILGLEENLILLWRILSMIWMFGALLALTPLDRERVALLPEGIRTQLFGMQTRFWTQERIKVICCIDYRTRSGTCRYLSVSALPLEQMQQQEERQASRTRTARSRLEADRLVPDWNNIAVMRYLCRRLALFGYWDTKQLLIAYSPEREQMLKTLYPHAQWFETHEEPINVNTNRIY